MHSYFKCLFILLSLPKIESFENKYRKEMLQTELLNSSNLIESLRTIQITNDKFYHVMFTAVIKKENMKMKILSCLENLMTSVLKHSEGSPLHFIVMTDESS